MELKDKFKIDNNQEIMDEKSYVDTNYKSLEATQALLSLGFEEKHINVVLLEVMERFPDESLESIIKECLKNLMR